MKANTWTWAALLLLTVSGFSASETAHGTTAAAFILGAAGLKSGLVGWRFMELRSAHVVWKLALFALLSGVLALVLLLVRLG
jgi:hypothetical protein